MDKKKININVLDLVAIVWEDKWKLIRYCFVGAVVGVIVAFSIPKIYKTTVILAPEESSNGFSGNISSLASMVGLDMKFGQSNDAIYPEIYPDLMSSPHFIVSLFPVTVKSQDGEINTNYFDYINKKQKFPWWNYPGAWLSEMVKRMQGTGTASSTKINPFALTLNQYDVMMAMKNDIDCQVDKKTSVISITVTAQDPLISATMADSVTQRLQVFITDYRTKKARNDLAYMQKLYEETHAQYVKARQLYASFSDANQELMLESLRSKQEDLENDMQLKYNIYQQVVGQLHLAKAKVQERTPAFTTIQASSVPVKHANKPKILTLILFTFLAAFVRFAILMFRNYKKFIN